MTHKGISKQIFFFVVLLLVPSIIVCGCQQGKPTPLRKLPVSKQALFKFAILGDSRPNSSTDSQPQSFKELIDLINQEKPAFVVHTGDIVFGEVTNEDIYQRQYQDFLVARKDLKVPLYTAVGNHDAKTIIGQRLYQQLIRKELYYSFDYKGSRFIILDTDMVGSQGKVDQEQLVWLEKELKSNKKANHTFVFMHRPLYSIMNPEGIPTKHLSFTDKPNEIYLKQLMKKYHVEVVFAGHEHFFNKQVKDSIIYVISGCAGAPPHTDEIHGGFAHYVLVEVRKNDISLTVVKATGERLSPASILTPAF